MEQGSSLEALQDMSTHFASSNLGAEAMKLPWVILVSGYGAFIHTGTEQSAEEMRTHKARWEGGIAKKRPADKSDMIVPSACWNHPGFNNTGGRYADCQCGACSPPSAGDHSK
jgi:hypothetical protein